MKEFELIKTDLLDSLLEIEDENNFYDLHNDFYIKKIVFDDVSKVLYIDFTNINEKTSLMLKFTEVDILNLNIPIHGKELTIDNFHRGRYEYEKKLFDEYEGKKCFYIEFYEGGGITLLSKKIMFEVEKNIKVIDIQDR